MMRVEVHQTEAKCLLKVEGEIAGPAATALETCWRKYACTGAAQVIVDVSDVVHIDRPARQVLRLMHNSGVRFTGARLAIQDILEEVGAVNANSDNEQ